MMQTRRLIAACALACALACGAFPVRAAADEALGDVDSPRTEAAGGAEASGGRC